MDNKSQSHPSPGDLHSTRRAGVLAPGDYVRHPTEAAWGLGQVQSVVGTRVTVNFEHAGKRLILADRVALEPAGLD